MSQQSIYLHKSVIDQIEFLAELLELSKSETVEDMLRHVINNDMEGDIWENYTEAMEDLESVIEESSSDEESQPESE